MQQNVGYLTTGEKLRLSFEKNKMPLLLGAGVVAVVALIGGFYVSQQKEKQVDAGKALSKVATAAPLSDGRRVEDAAGYLKVAADYPKTEAGARALLEAAGVLYTQGKFAEAETQFSKFVRDYPSNPFRPQALLGNAASLDAQGKATEAIQAYKNVIDRYPNETTILQAKASLARLYETQGQLPQAVALYQEVFNAAPGSTYSSEVGVKIQDLTAKLSVTNAPAGLAPATTQIQDAKSETPAPTAPVKLLSVPPPQTTNH